MKKYLIIFLIVLFPFIGEAAYKQNFACTSLTGGTVGALDYYKVSQLSEGDETHCNVSGEVFHFRFDYDGTDAEDVATHPYKVRPDDYTTQGVWIEQALSNIEFGADVTDATNVNAAGATMNADTDVSGNSWVLDQDNLGDDSNTKVPTQQSVKAYVDAEDLKIEGTEIKSTGEGGGTKFLREDGDGTSSWQTVSTSGIFENAQYPDSEASDQGAADGTYNSVKDIVDAIGSSEKAIIVFRHDGVGNTTTYNFSTDEVIPANFTVIMEPGALLADTGNVSLQILGPFISSRVKCFDWGGTAYIVFSTGTSAATKAVDSVMVEWWGAAGDGLGNTDNKAAIQSAAKAFNSKGGWVTFGSGEFDTGANGIEPEDGVYFKGVRPVYSKNQGGTKQGGTWLVTDTTGTSMFVLDAVDGGGFSDIGFWEDQGTPGGGWTVTTYQPVIEIKNGSSDSIFEDLFFMNNYSLINQTNGGASGRLTFRNIHGHPLHRGIKLEYCLDKIYMDNIHFWPFWTNDSTVRTWVKANGVAIYFVRVDNPALTNVFTFGYKVGLWLTHSADGDSHKVAGTNIEFDDCKYGIVMSSTSSAATGLFSNLSINNNATTGSVGIYMDGSSGYLYVNNLHIDNSGLYGIIIDGGGNTMLLDNVHIDDWNKDASSAQGIIVNSGSTLKIGSQRSFTGGGGEDNMAGAGTFVVDNSTVNMGAFASRNTEQDYTEYVNGTVVASIRADSDLDAGNLQILVDGSCTPSTARARASIQRTDADSIKVSQNSATVRVAADECYRVAVTADAGTPAYEVFWRPDL